MTEDQLGKLIHDMATHFGVSIEKMSKVLAQAYSGKHDEIRKYGVFSTSKADELLGQLDRLYSRPEQKHKTESPCEKRGNHRWRRSVEDRGQGQIRFMAVKPIAFHKATHRVCVGGCGKIVDLEGNTVRESRYAVQEPEVSKSADEEEPNGQMQERMLGGGVQDDGGGDQERPVPTEVEGRKVPLRGQVKASSAAGRRDRK